MNIVSSELNFLRPFYCPNLVRVGNKHDGGYILPEKLINNSDALLSFGYGYDCSFENDYINRTNNSVIIYDHTCDYYKLIKVLLKYLKRFLLFKKKIQDVKLHFNNLMNHHNFVNSKNVKFVKKKIVRQVKKKDDINVNETIQNLKFKNLILKCDIEGAEYEVLSEIIKKKEMIDCILVEFHEIHQNIEEFKKIIKDISQFYSIVHLHGNNHNPLLKKLNIPSTLEVTFVRKKFLESKNYINKFPIKNLDNPNNPNIKDLEFEFQ